jgi:hypothetical protein
MMKKITAKNILEEHFGLEKTNGTGCKWRSLVRMIETRTDFKCPKVIPDVKRFIREHTNYLETNKLTPKTIKTIVRKKKKEEKVLRKKFYVSEEWRKLRYKVLKKFKGCCCLCGRSYQKNGVVIHVDHIKPRSKYPELELDEDNLQLLCEDCNLGKSNRDSIDWRPIPETKGSSIREKIRSKTIRSI